MTWGGSYPGMLASFVRMKYPDLIHAAVASSAPVLGALDMPGYNDVTAQAYGLPSVGGTASCNASNNEIFLLIYCERSTRSHAFWNGFAILNLMPKVLAHR